MKDSSTLWVICLAALVFFAPTISSQVQTGLPPYGSFTGGPDVINLGNLNVHFANPVISKAGRGLPFAYELGYDSSVWYPAGVSGAQSWTPVPNWGWHGPSDGFRGWVAVHPLTFHCIDPNTGFRVNYYGRVFGPYQDSYGVIHPVTAVEIDASSICGTEQSLGPGTATDGSGYTVNPTGGSGFQLISRTGQIIHPGIAGVGFGSGTIIDSNGNMISANNGTFTDTLGMNVLVASGGAPNPLVFTYTDSSGTQRTVTVNYTTFIVKTNFGCSGISEYGPTSVSLVSSIAYPDGTSVSFSYEATPGFSGDVTGRVQSITLRTGSTITYAYTGGNSGIECADGSTAGLTRTTSDGMTAYSRTGSGTAWTTTSTDAQNNQTIINFQTVSSNFYETHRVIKQGASAVLRTVDSCYNGASLPCSNTAITLPITQIATYVTLDNNQMSYRNLTLDSGGLGLPVELDEYDFGNGAPGTLLRKTLTTYASLGRIMDRLASVIVQDGSGTQKAKTTFGYDETMPTTTSGVPQHTSPSSSRGNLTSVNRWIDNPSATLTNTYTYDDTGNVVATTDPGGHTTQYSYTDNFADGINRDSLAYVTQVTMPDTNSPNLAHHVTKAQYDANTGLSLKIWDQNNQATTFTYDGALRPLQVNFPDGGQTAYAYDETPNLNGVNVKQTIDSTRTTNSYLQLDSYGRQSRTAVANGESIPWDQQDFCCDSNGRLSFVSYPYQGNGWSTTKVCSGAGDTFSYDALGRQTRVTHSDGTYAQAYYRGRAYQSTDEGNGTSNASQIMQSDGLGRLISVCEVSASAQKGSGNVPSTCGLDIGGTGFLTTYAYNTLDNLTSVTQGTLNQRTLAYDSLSRLTSKTEPESGTTTYSYNNDSLLAQRVRPKVNQTNSSVTTSTNYVYDPLHRLTQRWYGDATGPNAYFNYDETAPLGISVSNSLGRLTLEYNNAGPESVYSYDAMGRVTSNWQCPLTSGCSSTGNYTQFPSNYDLMGNLTASTVAGATLSYVYNIAARPTSVASSAVDANHPANLLSNAHYNQFGQLTSASFGNVTSTTGISETRTYDTRGGILSEWSQINGGVGLEAYSGVTRAPNGNIRSVSDSISYGNWTYGYDDLNRLSSASYVGSSSGNYTYDYDRYGNRWHQTGGTQLWSQAFDSNNHILGWSYDAAGNLLNDGTHSYTYDAEGRLLTVDGGAPSGTTYTYDAEQRRVARTAGTGASATHYFLYDLVGRVAIEFDPVYVDRDEIYAGGRHVATYYAGLTFFVLPDWLGNERVKSTQDEVYEQSFANLPFGDGQSFWGSAAGWAGTIQFTGDEHDNESNLEHTWFRQYSSAQGRWLSPDPYSGSMNPMRPQSMNRYVYAADDPIDLTDTVGLATYKPGDPGVVIWGYDIFDALANYAAGLALQATGSTGGIGPGPDGGYVPGLSFNIDMFGNINWGYQPPEVFPNEGAKIGPAIDQFVKYNQPLPSVDPAHVLDKWNMLAALLGYPLAFDPQKESLNLCGEAAATTLDNPKQLIMRNFSIVNVPGLNGTNVSKLIGTHYSLVPGFSTSTILGCQF
jgi:RHS repeat-associated protein